MPPMPPDGSPIGAAFSGLSATTASVVRKSAAIEAAFCSAERVTFAGSRIPALNMRRPRLHTLFGVSNERGLSDVLLGTIELEDALIRTDVLNLSIIPGGQVPVRPAELLQSQAMISMMEELREKFDFVILDCPPILGLSDCLALVPLADATIMVVEAERTRAGAIADAVEQLDHVNVTVEGVVLNAVRVGRRGHHSYGYFLAAPKHLEADVVQANGDRQGVAALEDRRASGQKDKSKRTMPRAVGSSDPDS